jgi:hypothetical protein
MIIFPIICTLLLAQDTQELNPELRAAMFLGARSAQLQRNLPVVDQVVLVPDEATYLDEIARWSPEARWPVLFDKEPFVSQFIRRFSPEQVWRRDSVRHSIQNIERAMEQTVAQAWGGTSSIEIALTDLQLPPLGIVFTSQSDPARTAAVALAAGRGQLLKCMTSDWGDTHEILSHSRTSDLLQEIEEILILTGVKYAGLGDTIDAITLCQTMPARVEFSRPHDNPVALSDVIGRNDSGQRFAWTGWIFGSKAKSAYVAMCSLFLERNQYWFCNTYQDSGGWAKYGLGSIQQLLPKFGIESEVVDGTLAGLQQADIGGVTTDVAYFTTKGNPDFLDMADERTSPTWLPILDTPAALYFLHSWSLKNPAVSTTVGGTWLSRGVYAYVGSSHEPMLSAFVPPTEMLRKTMSIIPFLVAARWIDGESSFSKAWRVNTIGDPLMLCPPHDVVQRTKKPANQRADYLNMTELTQDAMRYAMKKPSDESFAIALGSLLLIGQDEMCVELWTVGTNGGNIGSISAHVALPALFRLRNSDAFLWAFSLIQKPTSLERDMLWQLVGTNNDAPLQVLIDNLRKPYEFDDLIVIVSRIASTRGSSAVTDIIDAQLQTAKGRNKRGLQRLKKEYGG